jgi:hypothetical protein
MQVWGHHWWRQEGEGGGLGDGWGGGGSVGAGHLNTFAIPVLSVRVQNRSVAARAGKGRRVLVLLLVDGWLGVALEGGGDREGGCV